MNIDPHIGSSQFANCELIGFDTKLLKKTSQNNRSTTNENVTSDAVIVSKIALPTEKGYEFLKINSILYCEANSNYCKIIYK